MFSVGTAGLSRGSVGQRARRAYEFEEQQSRELSAIDLRRALLAAHIGFRGGYASPPISATPGSVSTTRREQEDTPVRTPAVSPLLGEGGKGMRRLPEMIDRAVEGPADLVPRVPVTERRPGSERIHPTSLRAGGMSFQMRDIKDLVENDAAVGIEPSDNPFVMSLWTHVSKENDKHTHAKCSVVGNLAPRRGLARKIKYMSLNPSIYGNKYDVLGTS